MKPLNIVAQLINSQDGSRTETVTTTRANFANRARDHVPKEIAFTTLVLILADDSVTPDTVDFSRAPLMTVETFVSLFATNNVEVKS